MNITPKELSDLAEYIADYLTEELGRQGIGYNIGKYSIEDALLAYIGGAADHN